MDQFDALLAQTIASTLGKRCTWYGYQYSEILRSLMCVCLFVTHVSRMWQPTSWGIWPFIHSFALAVRTLYCALARN